MHCHAALRAIARPWREWREWRVRLRESWPYTGQVGAEDQRWTAVLLHLSFE